MDPLQDGFTTHVPAPGQVARWLEFFAVCLILDIAVLSNLQVLATAEREKHKHNKLRSRFSNPIVNANACTVEMSELPAPAPLELVNTESAPEPQLQTNPLTRQSRGESACGLVDFTLDDDPEDPVTSFEFDLDALCLDDVVWSDPNGVSEIDA